MYPDFGGDDSSTCKINWLSKNCVRSIWLNANRSILIEVVFRDICFLGKLWIMFKLLGTVIGGLLLWIRLSLFQ